MVQYIFVVSMQSSCMGIYNYSTSTLTPIIVVSFYKMNIQAALNVVVTQTKHRLGTKSHGRKSK